MREMLTELDSKPERKVPLGRVGHFLENNIIARFRSGIGCGNVDRFYGTQRGKLEGQAALRAGSFFFFLLLLLLLSSSSSSSRVDSIRMAVQEVGCGCMDWIGLAQDRDRWRTLVSAVMNLRVP